MSVSSMSDLLGTKWTERTHATQREQLGIIRHKHSQDQGKKPCRWSVPTDKVVISREKLCLKHRF